MTRVLVRHGIAAGAAWRPNLRRVKSNDEFIKNGLVVHVSRAECVLTRLDWALAGAASPLTVDLPHFHAPFTIAWLCSPNQVEADEVEGGIN